MKRYRAHMSNTGHHGLATCVVDHSVKSMGGLHMVKCLCTSIDDAAQVANALNKRAEGVPIGVDDRTGRPIHIGDLLEFDEKEYGAECRFTMRLRHGTLEHPGPTGDLSQWCTIIRGWDE